MNTTTKIVNPSTQILYEDEITIVSTQADYVNEDLAKDLKNVLSGIDIIIEDLPNFQDYEDFLNIDNRTKEQIILKIRNNIKNNKYDSLYKNTLNISDNEAMDMATKSAYDSL